MADQTELIPYQGRNYTVAALTEELQRYDTPIDRYNAQVEIRDYLLRCRVELDVRIEQFYYYVLADGTCWRVGKNLEDEEWKEAGRIAKDSEKRRKRFETATASILADWGEQAEGLIKDKSYTAMQKIQFLAKRVKLTDAWVLINDAILTRIKRTEEANRRWALGPNPVDYENAANKVERWTKGQITIPQIQQEDLQRYGLRVNEDGSLGYVEGTQGHVIGTLPNTPARNNALQSSLGSAQFTPLNRQLHSTVEATNDRNMAQNTPGTPPNDRDQPTLRSPRSSPLSSIATPSPPVTPTPDSRKRARDTTPKGQDGTADPGGEDDSATESDDDDDTEPTGKPTKGKGRPDKRQRLVCECPEEATSIAWNMSMNRGPMSFVEGLELLGQVKLEDICLLHKKRICKILGLRVPRDEWRITTNLQEIQDGAADPWKLKTDPETYPWFKDDHRPPRPKEILETTRYIPTETEPYCAPRKPLLADLRKQFTKKTMTEWQQQGIATFGGLFDWWWTETVEGYPESTVAEVMNKECAMYEHHSKRLHGLRSPLPNMLHSLVQQVARQDPAYYRLHVSLRPDNAWRFISYPCFLQLPLPDCEGAPDYIQGTIAIEDGNNYHKGDVIMAGSGHSDYLTRAKRGILPGFIAIKYNGETLELPHLHYVTGLAGSHRLLVHPGGYPEELKNDYGKALLRFPDRSQLGSLGPLSDALLGKRGWGSADVDAEVKIALGGRKNAEEFFQGWRSRAAAEVVKSFQALKKAEQERFAENSYFDWIDKNPNTPFPAVNDPDPPRTPESYERYCE